MAQKRLKCKVNSHRRQHENASKDTLNPQFCTSLDCRVQPEWQIKFENSYKII